MYGDLSYPLRVEFERPFVNPAAGSTPEQINYNKSMDEVQTLIECGFGDILSFSDFVDFKKKLRMGLSSVAKMYITCALLKNPHTCFYGPSISNYFEINPPSIIQYFQ